MNKTNNNKLNNKGFTLLEIVLVISILGILITMILPNFSRSQLSARVTTHNSNVNMLKSAGAMYLIDHPVQEKIDIKKKIDLDNLNPYLDQDSNMKVDPILLNEIDMINEFEVSITPKGNIVIEPGELIFKDNILSLKKVEKE